MTIEEIDQLPAGPELDALIAEKLMGLEVSEFDGQKRVRDHHPVYGPDTKVYKFPESYSTDMATAWVVLAEMKRNRWSLNLTSVGDAWFCQFSTHDGGPLPIHRYVEASGPTAPLAICRAALRTIRGKE